MKYSFSAGNYRERSEMMLQNSVLYLHRSKNSSSFMIWVLEAAFSSPEVPFFIIHSQISYEWVLTCLMLSVDLEGYAVCSTELFSGRDGSMYVSTCHFHQDCTHLTFFQNRTDESVLNWHVLQLCKAFMHSLLPQ